MSQSCLLWIGLFASRIRLAQAFSTDPTPQVSAVKFQTSLLQGFASHGVSIHILGALPIVPYPSARTLLVAADPFETEFPNVAGTLMWDINLPIVRLIVRFIASLYFGVRSLARGAKRHGIVVYPLHTPFLAAALLLKRFFKIPVFVFIPDLPAHTSGKQDKGLRAFAKLLDNKLLQALVAKADMAFPITEHSARNWLPASVKYLVVDGIAPSAATAPPKPPRQQSTGRILHTGQFSHVLGFAEKFVANPDIAARLVFIGGGPDGEGLSRLAASDTRITVKPFMMGEPLEKEFEAADFLLNPRGTQWEGAMYSFPSKLHDYMARGRPVLSTRMPGIPAEYFDCFFEISDDNADDFALSLKRALNASDDEIRRRIAIGETMLATTKSPKAVTARIMKAMSGINPRLDTPDGA